MANVCITYTWADGTEVEVDIHLDDSFPDVLDEARAQAVRALRQIVPDDVPASDD